MTWRRTRRHAECQWGQPSWCQRRGWRDVAPDALPFPFAIQKGLVREILLEGNLGPGDSRVIDVLWSIWRRVRRRAVWADRETGRREVHVTTSSRCP